MSGPRFSGYFADPFILEWQGQYYAYGTGRNAGDDGRAFEILSSPDLENWTSHGGALTPLPGEPRDYWAPEVAQSEGTFYMYYSAGIGDKHHHLRVATAPTPLGPFTDQGLNLTPDEPFAIDPHPFQDKDGQWYLYFARDHLDGERVGTTLAVIPMQDMQTPGGPVTTVLRASHDWQIYERERPMYNQTYDWHTLEGPFVVERGGLYHCFYSGGAWTNDTYGVGHAVAEHPLGPWREPVEGPTVLWSGLNGLIGPGHNSLIVGPDGTDMIVFHAWNKEHTQRQLHLAPLDWVTGNPRLHS
ncbi:glycoside hydrolase family 43 protein [Deinococcus sp. QL22]|uniref:glycoside hydrolase family 43 protein n=1 Tax=Deinococcus sp. QL22 TaxID=2939437 RepID=UPI002016BA39|nr:glycoside hydrolase family 43 protein [Deinococcus sp. QL22]UQN09726.1 glycoside hydrolase family 43 protein [Deinococcus sp. QL22]